ncbi:MAG TPA: hypothetical protein PK481_08410 [Bacillota bacterium]|nr:hypothetical protein [Bacillota bacterium]
MRILDCLRLSIVPANCVRSDKLGKGKGEPDKWVPDQKAEGEQQKGLQNENYHL